MRRHDALIPLTHDHHHALAQARKLHLAAASGTEQRGIAAREFIDFFRQDTLEHFRNEEETIFPLVVEEEEAEAPLARLMNEHLRIHGLVRTLTIEIEADDPQQATLEGLSDLLEAHIRFEEKTFFPLVERLAPSALAVLFSERGVLKAV
jgi:iron-sulfur cluster repair protein YtfE (RIC family)